MNKPTMSDYIKNRKIVSYCQIIQENVLEGQELPDVIRILTDIKDKIENHPCASDDHTIIFELLPVEEEGHISVDYKISTHRWETYAEYTDRILAEESRLLKVFEPQTTYEIHEWETLLSFDEVSGDFRDLKCPSCGVNSFTEGMKSLSGMQIIPWRKEVCVVYNENNDQVFVEPWMCKEVKVNTQMRNKV